MEPVQFVDKLLLPMAISMLYFILYKYKHAISKAFKDKKLVKGVEDFLGVSVKLLASNFKLKNGDWKSNIIIPIVSVLIIDGSIMAIFQSPMLPPDYPLWFLIIIVLAKTN